MKTTYTLGEKINGIQEAREIVGHISQDGRLHIPIPSEEKLTEISDKLNAAGGYLMSMNMTKDLVDKGREEYLTKLFELSDKILVADGLEHEKELENQVAAMSYDELAKAHRRVEELEEALKQIIELKAMAKNTQELFPVLQKINQAESLLKQQ